MIYKILETKQATQQWIYEVEANNAEDAIAMVLDGDVECIDYIMDTDEFQEDSNIEVIDFYEKTAEDQGPEYDSAGYSIEDRNA
jgi:hypothetical protein